jgi:type III pantothenate kinase
MNLIVDIGNTRAKVAVVLQGEVIADYNFASVAEVDVEQILRSFPQLERAIVASSGESADRIVKVLENSGIEVVELSCKTSIPIKNDYATPQTLGVDRLAAAVGAVEVLGYENCLIVDFGTAITIDWVENGAFKGGNISPGATTRFRALHDYTSRLPLCSSTEEILDYGCSTTEAIEQGVMQGITNEIEGYISTFSKKNDKIVVIFTGGEAKFFVNRIKNAIFAKCDLIVCGLNRILEYNASDKK